MHTLAPEVVRQRLLIEGYFTREVDEAAVRDYFSTITTELELRAYAEPFIHSPGAQGKAENQGFDAFIPLIDSGISLYVWTQAKFFSVIVFTCKRFDEGKAIAVTRAFFQSQELSTQAF